MVKRGASSSWLSASGLEPELKAVCEPLQTPERDAFTAPIERATTP